MRPLHRVVRLNIYFADTSTVLSANAHLTRQQQPSRFIPGAQPPQGPAAPHPPARCNLHNRKYGDALTERHHSPYSSSRMAFSKHPH
jgi:hypothetical protein